MRRIIFVISILTPLILLADDLQTIRSWYKQVNDGIKLCIEKSPECSWYQNELIINKDMLGWRAVGNYKKTVNFWYDDDPAKCDECGEEGLGVLKKVEVKVDSEYKTWMEFLFKEGKLIFFYYKYERGEEQQQLRFYFREGILIEHKESVQPEGEFPAYSKKDNQKVLKMAMKYQQLFLNGF